MNKQDPVVIVGQARTPLGSFQGELKDLSAADLGAAAIVDALKRAGLAPDAVDEVMFGCVLTAGQGQAPARQAALSSARRRRDHREQDVWFGHEGGDAGA